MKIDWNWHKCHWKWQCCHFFSEEAMLASQAFMTSVVVGKDIVPRYDISKIFFVWIFRFKYFSSYFSGLASTSWKCSVISWQGPCTPPRWPRWGIRSELWSSCQGLPGSWLSYDHCLGLLSELWLLSMIHRNDWEHNRMKKPFNPRICFIKWTPFITVLSGGSEAT